MIKFYFLLKFEAWRIFKYFMYGKRTLNPSKYKSTKTSIRSEKCPLSNTLFETGWEQHLKIDDVSNFFIKFVLHSHHGGAVKIFIHRDQSRGNPRVSFGERLSSRSTSVILFWKLLNCSCGNPWQPSGHSPELWGSSSVRHSSSSVFWIPSWTP